MNTFHPENPGNRRTFLKKTGATVLGTALIGLDTFAGPAFEENKNNVLKVGLVGCGGRGTGAALQALKADPGVHITALGDVFEDKLNQSLATLQKTGGDRVKVDNAHRFIGFDAYQKVIDSGVDVGASGCPALCEAGSPGSRYQSREACFRREARSSRRARRTQYPGFCEAGKRKKPLAGERILLPV